ncbi:MAG: hypothetical protein HC923_03175 [Myxococcales bacterium]|nr:hypothetical protein [Myxococcales bacterium]
MTSLPVNVGDLVWTFWWDKECPGNTSNGTPCLGPDQMVFAPGTVLSGTNPLQPWFIDPFTTDQMIAQGSGSVTWRQDVVHRIISVGMGTNAWESASFGGPGTHWRSRINSVLNQGRVDTNGYGVGRNEQAFFADLGLTAAPWSYADYASFLDIDNNDRFDVIERLDAVQGLNQAKRCGSGSRVPAKTRCGRSVRTLPSSFREPLDVDAFVSVSGPPNQTVLQMNRVGFGGTGSGYRFSIMTNTTSSCGPRGPARRGSAHGVLDR